VLLAIDLAAGAILFAIDLRVFLPGQLAAVSRTVGTDLLVDALLAVPEARYERRRRNELLLTRSGRECTAFHIYAPRVGHEAVSRTEKR
jgi:hypothetical protein